MLNSAKGIIPLKDFRFGAKLTDFFSHGSFNLAHPPHMVSLHTIYSNIVMTNTGKKSLFCHEQNGKQMVKYRIGFCCRPNLKYFDAQNG